MVHRAKGHRADVVAPNKREELELLSRTKSFGLLIFKQLNA